MGLKALLWDLCVQVVEQHNGDCVLVPPGWPYQVTNHAPHLKLGWNWFDVPKVDYFVWSHQNVYIKHFNLEAEQPRDYVKIITCMEGEIQRLVDACPALRAQRLLDAAS